jgi:hypothetical protein
MSRALWLLIAAGVAVWAAAFLQVEERARPAAASEPEPEPAATAPAPPAPSVPSAPAQPVAAVEAVPAAEPTTPPNVVQPAAPRGVLATATATIRAARDAFVPGPKRLVDEPPAPAPDQVATGELGEGTSSPEYHAVERAYTHEPRDGAWAANEERLLRFSLRSTPLNQQLALVNCQQTICRMVFERAEANAFEQLVRNPEVVKITGLSAASPHSYRSGQLSVYFARRSAIVEDNP